MRDHHLGEHHVRIVVRPAAGVPAAEVSADVGAGEAELLDP